jgi:hypothetical protein
MLIFTVITIIIICHFASTMAFCHINTATPDLKYTMLHSKQSSKILVNNLINKYSRQNGVSASIIKSCIDNFKKTTNSPIKKTNLRINKNKI